MKTTTDKTGIQRNRRTDGKYMFDGNLDRLCRCGHTLARHMADHPHECSFGSQKEDIGERCSCEKFRPVKG